MRDELHTVVVATIAVMLLAGCAGTDGEAVEGDARDASFAADGRADSHTVEENTPEARAILEVVNTYSIHRLVRDVDLYWHASSHIVRYRKGEDGIRNSDDDRYVTSMAELDDIAYVGPKSLEVLRTYVHEFDLVASHNVAYSDEIPAHISTDGAAFRGKLAAGEEVGVFFSGTEGDRVLMWLRKSDAVTWNPKISVARSDDGDVIEWANPWGYTDARVPYRDEDVADGWRVPTDEELLVVLENTGDEDGAFEFMLECIGGPCFERPVGAAGVLDGNFEGLVDEELREQMVARHERTHTYLAYRDARHAMFSDIDNDAGEVECVYTGTRILTNDIPPNSLMNAEHTWPQSKGAVDGAARTDLHHLFPVLSAANSVRESHPFCEVVEVRREMGDSIYGYGEDGEPCFEPGDDHKGNAARAMFYFAAVYQQEISASEEGVLRRWHASDPVDSEEEARNEAIEQLQGSRNFFVDDPELVDRVDDF